MGVNYSFTMRVGYSLDEDDITSKFQKTIPGEYHFEDRFNPKTGEKIKPVKICDKEPITILSINDLEIDNDPEIVCYALSDLFHCIVDFSYSNDDLEYHFSPIGSIEYKNFIDYGRIDIRNYELDYDEVVKMKPALHMLEVQMRSVGLEVGKPRVYISSVIG